MSILSGFEVSKPEGSFTEFDEIVNLDFGIHKMKPNQKLVYSYINERWFILSEPPGAGKSTSIKFVVSELLRKNPKLKVIIAVPQTLISKSFGSIILEYPNGNKVEWDISNNLCERIGNLDKIGELNNFINQDEFGNNPADRIAIVTHITLSKLNTEGENFNDVMFIIDEGHHVLYPENGGTESANKIGVLVHYIMNQKKSNVKIWFATATFYRGDKSNIIPPEEMEKFTTYHLPLDEYWSKYIKHIQSFSYDFVMYKNRDVFSEIKEIFKQKGKRKTIIFCPYIGYLVNDMNKLQFRDKIIEVIKEVWEDCKFLDLIEIENRYDKKQIVINDSEDFDVVLSVKLFDEGTDWVQAESIIDLCPSNSLRIQVQRFGRLLRDIYGKTHIDYNVFLPYESKFKDDEERRLHMSRSFNVFTASCLLDEAIEPVMKPGVKNNVKSKLQPLTDLGINDSQKQDLIEKVIKDLMFLKNLVNTPSISESKECIINSIKDFGIKNNIEEVVEFVVKTLRRSSIHKLTEWESQTIDISWMIEKGFDKVWDDSLYDSLLSFSTGICGVDTFMEFRNIYSQRKTLRRWVKIAENLAKDNHNKIPCKGKLLKMNLGGLVWMLQTKPEFFSHLVIENKNMSLKEARVYAKKMASLNGGQLNLSILRKNGDWGLLHQLKINSEYFKDITIETNLRNKFAIQKHLKTCIEFVKLYKGIPCITWLVNNNYDSFYTYIKKYPEHFQHFKILSQIETSKSLDVEVFNSVILKKHLKTCTEFVKLYKGIPCTTWLRRNHKPGLMPYILKHKEAFKNFKILSAKETKNAIS